MDFDNVLKSRRTARVFENKEIKKDHIYKILKAGSLGPSAKNRQPWKFYILNNLEKNKIAQMLLEWEKDNPDEKTSVKGTAKQIMSAPKMIMVYADNYSSKSKMTYYKKPDYLSIGTCLENMSLEAVNLGLGSCIICDTLYITNEINNMLNINNYEQICSFIVGKPIFNCKDAGPIKEKKTLDNLILNKNKS